MTAIALKSMGERKLRTALTAIAILLGVAMVAGTYVQTDQIRTAFDDIQQTAYQGVDVNIAPRSEFSSDFGRAEPFSERIVEQARGVDGVARAEPELWDTGSLVVGGKVVEPKFAPASVGSLKAEPFNPMRVVEGRFPRGGGEIVVNEKLFEDENLRLGQRVGVTTRTGEQPARVVGVVRFGDVASVGGATMIIATLGDVQRWFDRDGRVSEISVAADEGVAADELARRLQASLPDTVEVKTGEQKADDTADEINDALGFLTPALLAFAGAALLVGAFIIFNTFSITIAERTREFAMLRALGATRRQVLGAVTAEALLLGVAASLAGLAAGLGIAKLIGGLFDAAGMGIPRADMELAPRTIVAALAVGIGVTLASAVFPAIRATRVAPVAAMHQDTVAAPVRHRRVRAVATCIVALLGLVLLAQGLLGSGPATSRLGAMGAGTLLVFVGVALSARYIVRPLAAAVGWPLERLGRTTGALARENATRNPARTAVTAAALMVGLGLVVFVAVFAAGLKSSLVGTFDDRIRADYIITSNNGTPLPVRAQERLQAVVGADGVTAQFFEQVQVNDDESDLTTDIANAVEPATLSRFYSFDWQEGSDSLVARLREGPNAVIEEQFAKAHGLEVGDRFRLMTATGRSAVYTAIGEYRDPQLLQGVIVSPPQLQRISSATDPYSFMVRGGTGDQARGQLERALAAFPAAKVRTTAEYRDFIVGELDSIVFLLYALLAMSIVISLFGIANSLFLAIHERTREIGMLRAIGATAKQVKQMIRYESVITAVIGGLLGTVIGVVFAWLTTFALEDLGLVFAIPGAQLVVFLLLAVVVGVIGAIAPARRAARLNILEAVSAGE